MSFKEFVQKTEGTAVAPPKPTVAEKVKLETPQQRYERLSKECGFKIGDKVKVIAKAVTNQFGWANSWEPTYMTPSIGNVYEITSDDHGGGYNLAGTHCSYPFFVLELVEAKEPEKAVKGTDSVLDAFSEWLKGAVIDSGKSYIGTTRGKEEEPDPEDTKIIEEMRKEFGSKTQL